MNLISSTSLLRIRYSGRRFPTRSSPDAPSVVPGFVATTVPVPSSATLSRCSWAVTAAPSRPCEIQQANQHAVISIGRFICIASSLFVRRISIKLARSYLRGRFVARHEKCCLPKWSIRNVVLFWPAEARLIRKLCRKRRWSELKPERVQLYRNSTLSTLAMSTKVDLWDVRFPIINDLDLYSGRRLGLAFSNLQTHRLRSRHSKVYSFPPTFSTLPAHSNVEMSQKPIQEIP